MKFNKLISTSLLMALTMTTSSYASENPAFIQFVRPLGMGGAFTAVADDHNIFFFNPAGMVQRTGAQTTLLEIAGGVSTDLLDAKDFIDDHENELTHYKDLSTQQQIALSNQINREIVPLRPRANVAADVASFVSGPKFFGMPIHGGFGAFGQVDASFRFVPGITPALSFDINNDIVLPLSIAHRWDAPWKIPGKIGVGLTGKFIRRSQMSEQNISILQFDGGDLKAPPLQTGHGIGGDLGFLYQPHERFNFGVMVQDLGGTKLSFDKADAEKGYAARPAKDSVIRPRTNIGAAMTPKKLLWLLPTNDRWMFAADVRDIAPSNNEHVFFESGLKKPFGENLYTRIHLGAELRWWFFRFRGGAYQGYPSFGLGLDIPFLKLDYAYYARERGLRAGDDEEKNHVISLALRFGSGATESRERIKKAKEARKSKDNAMPEAETSAPAPMVEEPVAAPAEAAPVAPAVEETPAPEMEATPSPTPVATTAPTPTPTPAKSKPARTKNRRTLGR